MADLSELFARLKSPNSNPSDPPPTQPTHHYNQPSVSSPILSPPHTGSHPRHESAIMSPNSSAVNTPSAEPSSDRTASLLNLLKFNQPQQSSPRAPSRQTSVTTDSRPIPATLHNVHAEAHTGSPRPVSATDLVASFMRKPSSSSITLQSPAIASPASGRAEVLHGSASENPQDLLLKLLNQPKSSAASDAGSMKHIEANRAIASSKSPSASINDIVEQLAETQIRAEAHPVAAMPDFGNGDAAHNFSIGSIAPTAPVFTYANPFEQLERSSPLNVNTSEQQKSQLSKTDTLKHEREISTTSNVDRAPGPSTKMRKLTRTPETKGATQETVSNAVSEVGLQVEKELEGALADAESKDQKLNGLEKELASKAANGNPREVKREMEDEETRKSSDVVLDKAIAHVAKEPAEEVVNDNVADSWESADAEDGPLQPEGAVKVFNFPMRPFTTIDVQTLHERTPTLRSKIFMDVAKLKKEFDQMDRQLVSASRNFIVYATLKPLGFRVIRQETGQFRQVFSTSKERLFNIATCGLAPGSATADTETVLGTGVNGSIFWTEIPGASADIADENLDAGGFIFPPAPVHDDNTSGGQLKTRAKTSTRHPDFFAVGRGKSIHLVHPKVARMSEYTDSKSRICDSEKYLKERSLKIMTGKAGKDFAFSADDTVIVSLDKAGRMRFWDIRPLWEAAETSPEESFEPITIRTPLWTLQTTSQTDKSWPTSVFFLDKERPLTKGIALRYMIVGQKQNHTLQLWDLGLGKAVQELNLPHDNESDAICTVAYHAKSGVMVVGHPTRNSLYFVHISAPKYNLPPISQARYLSTLADSKSGLPKPDSTAIMSGIREYSLGSTGKLRSLFLLDEHVNNIENFPPGDAPVFELYLVHSKGVCLVNIFREDLGWTKDFRVQNPVDAAATGAVDVNPLRPPQAVTEGSANGDARTATSTQSTARDSKKEPASSSRAVPQTPEAAIRASTLAKVESKQEAERAALINGSDKADKKKKKRATDTLSQTSAAPSRTASTVPLPPSLVSPLPSYAQAAQRPTSPLPQAPSTVASTSRTTTTFSEAPEWALKLFGQSQVSSSSANMDELQLERLTSSLVSDVAKSLTDNLNTLYKRIDDDKRALDASSSAKHEAVLRLVSSTLSENLDQAFGRHIRETVSSSLVPDLTKTVSNTLSQQIGKTLHQTTTDVVTREFKSSLPGLVAKAMQEPDTLRIISDLVASKVNKTIDGQVAASVQNIVPALSNMALKAAQQVASQADLNLANQIRQAEAQRQDDARKIDQLTHLVQNMNENMSQLAAANAKFHDEILRMQVQFNESPRSRHGSREVTQPETVEDEELENIKKLIQDSRYEEGTIAWLQSSRQGEMFDLLFVRMSPTFIQHLSSLVALSVAAAATSTFDSHVNERLAWLDAVLTSIDPKDGEIIEVVPKIMDVLSSRLHNLYVHVSERDGSSAASLRRIAALIRITHEIKNNASFYHGVGTRG